MNGCMYDVIILTEIYLFLAVLICCIQVVPTKISILTSLNISKTRITDTTTTTSFDPSTKRN